MLLPLPPGVVDTLVTGKMLKREPRVTLDAVRMGRKKMFVTSAKAERELGWNPGPVDGALRRAVDWFQANGYVPKSIAIVARCAANWRRCLRGVQAEGGLNGIEFFELPGCGDRDRRNWTRTLRVERQSRGR